MADQTHPETPANPENRPNPDNPADTGNTAALGSPVRAGDTDTADALLRELAAAYGVDTSYWGWDGVQRSVAAGTLQDVLAALGVVFIVDVGVEAGRVDRGDVPAESGQEGKLPVTLFAQEDPEPFDVNHRVQG